MGVSIRLRLRVSPAASSRDMVLPAGRGSRGDVAGSTSGAAAETDRPSSAANRPTGRV